MLELPLQDQCDVIFVPCLLTNPLTGKQCIVDAVWDTGSQNTAISEEVFKTLELRAGEEVHVKGSAGIADGWQTECNIALTEFDQWSVKVDVLPELPVHVVIGMDIISSGNLSLAYEPDGYMFRFEQVL